MKLIASATLLALAALACAKPGVGSDGSVPPPGDGTKPDFPGHTPGMPGLGGHGLGFHHLGENPGAGSLSATMSTQSSGSMIVVGIGRGNSDNFTLPTDNKGNAPYVQLDAMHPYDAWPDAGTSLYSFTSARGGSDFRVSTTRGNFTSGSPDEITLAAVEVIEGSRIEAVVWNEVLGPATLRSRDVKTTGPATLIAFWWGDGYPGTPQSATPNNGFVPIDTNAQESGSFVQCVVAVKNVSAAGTYNVTWDAMPAQGAQLWLVAVQ